MNTKKEMNQLELYFKYCFNYYERNTESFVIGKGENTDVDIKYTPDFIFTPRRNIVYSPSSLAKPLWFEIKGFSRSTDQYGPMKKKLIKEYCAKYNIIFIEYHLINPKTKTLGYELDKKTGKKKRVAAYVGGEGITEAEYVKHLRLKRLRKTLANKKKGQ